MNPHLLDITVQQYINEHLDDDITRILLRKSPFANVSSKELAEQIDSKKRCEKKLHLWFNTSQIYYPPKLSIEQSSSELTAAYKSELAKGDTLLDLTGGFGVDSYFFSKKVKKVISCELNKELSQIAAYNAIRLQATNINFLNADSIVYLRETRQEFDTIFVDPSRRVKSSKVFMLKDCEPDVAQNLTLLLSKAGRILIKTSPLLDISSGLRELNYVSSIHVLSVKNDCKELLWILERDYNDEPEILCVAMNGTEVNRFSFRLSEERSCVLEDYSLPGEYLYEPDVALLKGGCFKLIAERYSIQKLHPNTHLYTSSTLLDDFAGRKFRVLQVMDYKAFTKEHGRKANVISRNFPQTTEELKKRHKIQDGGKDFLLFTTAGRNKLMVIHAQKA